MKRKIVLMSESDREAFLSFCDAVKNTEADKDTFLKAARLERNEARLTGEQIYWLSITRIWAGVVALLLTGFFAYLIFK